MVCFFKFWTVKKEKLSFRKTIYGSAKDNCVNVKLTRKRGKGSYNLFEILFMRRTGELRLENLFTILNTHVALLVLS